MHEVVGDLVLLDGAECAQTHMERDERGIYAEQARASGKPEAIIEKMVEGRMRKFYEEAVLLEQAFIMDPEKKVKDVLAENKAEVSTFVRFNLGEGIEKKQENFAEEVAKQMG